MSIHFVSRLPFEENGELFVEAWSVETTSRYERLRLLPTVFKYLNPRLVRSVFKLIRNVV